MFFISCQKHLCFSRYLNFYHDFFGHVGKQRDKKAQVSFKMYGVIHWDTNNYNSLMAQYL